MTTASYASFPTLKFGHAPVAVKEHIEKGTGTAKIVGAFMTCILTVFVIVITYGIGLVLIPLGWAIDHFNSKKIMALLRGSAIEVGPEQFPEIYGCAQEFANRLGMRELPAIYIVEGNIINAAASRIGSRHVITLVDDVVDACLRSGDPRAIAFVLAHELAHHALGHTSRWQAALSSSYKKLSRLNELSCDSVAVALVGDANVVAHGLLVLLTGPQLVPYVNVNALIRQAEEVAQDKTTLRAENRLSHPLLLRRVQRVLARV